MGSSKADVEVSYDVSNEFFRLWLDERMNYTCAVFESEGQSLEAAQINKLKILSDFAKLPASPHQAEDGASGRDERALRPIPHEGREVLKIDLAELPVEASRALARAVLGEGAEATLIDAIAARSGGNAFYLEEILRSVRAGKGIASLPETVIAMVHAHLDAASPAARRALRAASVFGDTFLRSGIAALLGGAGVDEEVKRCLDELVEQDLLSRAPAGAASRRAKQSRDSRRIGSVRTRRTASLRTRAPSAD